MSKYTPLRDYLLSKQKHVSKLHLFFREIEEIINSRLPVSALEYREWWSNQLDYTNRPQARAWMETDFRVDCVNQSTRNAFVTFRHSQKVDK